MIGVDTTLLVQVSIREHPEHAAAKAWLDRTLASGTRLVLTPQVLTEVVHIITDAKRHEFPVATRDALRFAERWWDHESTVRVYPDAASVALFFEWMRKHRLGRKRLLDTHLAATYWTAGIRRIVSSDQRGFGRFGLEVLSP